MKSFKHNGDILGNLVQAYHYDRYTYDDNSKITQQILGINPFHWAKNTKDASSAAKQKLLKHKTKYMPPILRVPSISIKY